MKDAYSFDVSSEAADVSYQAMYNAYVRIFKRCGLRTKVVEADTGGHGRELLPRIHGAGRPPVKTASSSARHAPTRPTWNVPSGKTRKDNPLPPTSSPRSSKTPGQRTIDEVSAFLKIAPRNLIKTLIYVANGKPIAVLVPGDRDLNEHKLARALGGVTLEMADDETIVKATGAPVGFAGPVGLRSPSMPISSSRPRA